MRLVRVASARGANNETSFNLIDEAGVPVNLTALGVTLVKVEVCGPLVPCGSVVIDSDGDGVSFAADLVKIKFGLLGVNPSARPYYPKISYFIGAVGPEVIAGQGFNTEIELQVVC